VAPGKVSITFDAWTSESMTAYQAITGHFIDEGWHLNSQLLSLDELEGRHTGENMAFDLLKTIAKYIGVDKVICSQSPMLQDSCFSHSQLGHATADNAANNDKALTELEKALHDVGQYDWNSEDKRIQCVMKTLKFVINLLTSWRLDACHM